jgi:hypothetical protein
VHRPAAAFLQVTQGGTDLLGDVEALQEPAGEAEDAWPADVLALPVGAGEAVPNERLQDAVHGRFRQRGALRDVRDARVVRQGLQDLQGLVRR